MDIDGEGIDSQELLEMDENPDVENDVIVKDSDNCDTENANPLMKLVVKAVLQAVSIMDNSGASINTFEDVLDYGKAMLLESISSDIDVIFSWSYGQKTGKQSNHFLRNRVILMLRSITFAPVEKRKRCGDVERQV